MKSKTPENLNPHTRKKFEAIGTYDPYENVISELNKSFHHSYNMLVHKRLETLGQAETPVVVIESDKAILFWNGEQESKPFIPDLYHKVKSIGHVSFGLYLTLRNNGVGSLTDEIRGDLEHQKEWIEEALKILDEENIPANYVDVYRMILGNALGTITKVLDQGALSQNWIESFSVENTSLYLENAKHAARLELDVLNDVIMDWKSKMTTAQWDALLVVICSGHQSRYRHAAVQYFYRLLDQQEGAGASMEDRVIYGENIHGFDAAMDILARHLIDQSTSIELFGNKTRMQEDLMADGAESYLNQLFED